MFFILFFSEPNRNRGQFSQDHGQSLQGSTGASLLTQGQMSFNQGHSLTQNNTMMSQSEFSQQNYDQSGATGRHNDGLLSQDSTYQGERFNSQYY